MTQPRTPPRPLRVFVASGAELLTDHATHGEGLIAWETFSALARRGHELVVCARRVDLASESPFEVIEVGRTLRWESLEPLAYARRVRRLFEQRGGARAFDAVHWLFPQDPLCFVPPKGVTFVVGPRLPSWRDDSRQARPRRPGDAVRLLASPAFAAQRRRALGRAHVLVSIPSALDELPAGVRGRARTQPFGVDDRVFRPTPLPATPTILFVGRLDPQKRIRALVEAFADVVRVLPEARLVVAGDGPERGAVEELCASHDVRDAVELLGAVPHADVAALFERSSVLCLPSVGEPFGMVVLEAMASGRAVVAVAAGGPGWLVDPGRGGALVAHGTPAELADALVEVLRDPSRPAELGAHNRRKVESELSVVRVAESLERAYASPPFSSRVEAFSPGLSEAVS